MNDNYAEINWDKIDKNLYSKKNIIYGAGYNGKLLYKLMEDKALQVEAFYDDDDSRWSEMFCGKKIISKEELVLFDKSSVNIIISSMYVNQIWEKVLALGFKNVYTIIDKLLEKDTKSFEFYKYSMNKQYIENLEKLINSSEDNLTKQYFELIRNSVLAGKALKGITELYCGEKQYLLKCFKNKLDGINFLDAGAYTGDTVQEILSENIQPMGIYCFEADKNNYDRLSNYIKSNFMGGGRRQLHSCK